MNIGEVYNRIHLWRKENIKERHFLLFTCFIVGILTALAAYLLKLAIHFIELFLTNNFHKPVPITSIWSIPSLVAAPDSLSSTG